MNFKHFALLAVLLAIAATTATAEPNVLVIASTRPYSSQQGVKPMDEPSIKKLVQDRIASDLKIRGKINIVIEDVFRMKQLDTAVGGGGSMGQKTYKCHSLAQWYLWPEGKAERMANLQGKGGTKWDAVVIMGDASIIANMPGVFAEGATLIIDKVREGSGQPLLYIPPTDNADTTAAITEAVTIMGVTADVAVLPKPSHAIIQKVSTSVPSKSNVFAMKYVDKRAITYNHTGTSSERGLERGIKAAVARCRVTANKADPAKTEGKIDFNYGRANSNFEKHKQYKVEPNNFDRSYGFPMQDHSKSAAETMLYGIDRRGDDGTDLGIAWDMINQNEVEKDVRCVPIRLMFAKLNNINPELKPCGDSWHMSKYLDTASGTFIYTLLSGRCPVDDKPSPENKDAYNHWLGQTIGYETAWRMSHLGARVPGFVVRPSGASALEVKFLYPPTTEVTVAVGADRPDAAEVSPKTLTFTPENYSKAQSVSIKTKADSPFSVKLLTQSNDVTFNQLQDSWPFTAAP